MKIELKFSNDFYDQRFNLYTTTRNLDFKK